MTNRQLLGLFLVIIAGFTLQRAVQGGSSFSAPPGIAAPGEPLQGGEISPQDLSGWEKLGYQIRPRATYDITARVVYIDTYSWSAGADLSPLDFTLAWDKLSDTEILNKLSISHSFRYFHWSARELPLPMQEIVRSMANVHLIPSQEYVTKRLKKVKKGEVVRLKGYLVDVDKSDGFTWRTSLTRDDSGSGACELLWVDEINYK